MGSESLYKSFSSKVSEEISSVKARFSQEGSKVKSDDSGDMDALESSIQSLQSKSQTLVSLMDSSFSISNFTKDTSLADWKNRYPYIFSIVEANSDSDTGYYSVASFRLLIGPQDITINSPFAIKTTVTSGGILEEHNGIPLKQITINGTTGINIIRPSNDSSGVDTSIMGALFGGTIDASASFVKSIQSSANNFTKALNGGGGSKVVNQNGFDTKGTGYYQYQMLRIFLETYAKLKKSPRGRAYRLVFEMHKDKQFYLVTPNVFNTKKSVSSPMEYLYTISMTAWGSIDKMRNPSIAARNATASIKRDLGTTRNLLNALKESRKVAVKAKNVISNARADVESNIFGPINDAILLAKDALGIPLALADMPKSLRDSFQTSVISNWESLSRTNEDLKALLDSKIGPIVEGRSDSNSAQPYLKSSIPGQQDYFVSDSFDNIDVTDAIDLNSLTPTVAQQQAVDSVVANALQINENDMRDLASELQALSDALESEISSRAATGEDWDILYSTQASISSIYAFIADGSLRVSKARADDASVNTGVATTALDFWEQTTTAANIPFNTYSGKFSVPFPFRSSLEELARIYLGNATLWQDIAALNGLQAPYVDEDGFTYSLIANGSGNIINVSSNKNLYVGQSVYISSDTELVTKRKIQAINEITPTNFQIVLTGAADMNIYKSLDNASLKAYLPYTVNSMKQIYIPTNDEPSTQDEDTKPISFIDDDIDFIKFSKIDLLLDSNFDLAVTSDGFANLAYGKANLLQAAKLKLATVSGSKLLDPTFGGGVEVGESAADIDIDAIIANINSSFESDGRFGSPSSINVRMNGNSIVMDIAVSVKNRGGILPITIPLTQ